MRRPALLVRFPLWRPPRESPPPVVPEAVTDYPELADDISTARPRRRPGVPRGGPLGAAAPAPLPPPAGRHHSLGSALLTGLGGLQAVFPQERWPGLVLALLGALLTGAEQTP